MRPGLSNRHDIKTMSEDKEEETKTVRAPTFDVTDDKYQKWRLRFKAYAKLAGVSKSIRTTTDVDLPSNQVEEDALTGTEPETKLKKKAVAINEKAIASFTLAFATDTMLSLVVEYQK